MDPTTPYALSIHFSVVQISSFNRNIIVKQYQKDGKCQLQLSDPLRVSSGSFLALGILQKGSKYTDAWSHAYKFFLIASI